MKPKSPAYSSGVSLHDLRFSSTSMREHQGVSRTRVLTAKIAWDKEVAVIYHQERKSPREVRKEFGFICEIEVDLLLGAKCRHTRREWRSKSVASVANGKHSQAYIDCCSKLLRFPLFFFFLFFFSFLFDKPISSPIIEKKEKVKSQEKASSLLLDRTG